MGAPIYNDELALDVLEFARQGYTNAEIAKLVGVTTATFGLWRGTKPIIKKALAIGRKRSGGKATAAPETFIEYVYERMAPEMKAYWDLIQMANKAKSGPERIDAILDHGGRHVRKYLFVYAWVSTNFQFTRALHMINTSRKTFELWKDDIYFAQLLKEVFELRKDWCEDALFTLVQAGNENAIRMVNESLNTDRGYGKRIGIEMKADVKIKGQMSGDEFDLETRKTMLKQMREKEKTDE
jgi:hypothetical protein